jgi:hypothetical protein
MYIEMNLIFCLFCLIILESRYNYLASTNLMPKSPGVGKYDIPSSGLSLTDIFVIIIPSVGAKKSGSILSCTWGGAIRKTSAWLD